VSDTKQFVFSETIDDLHQQNSQRFQLTANDVTESALGPGGAWTSSSTTLDGGDATRYDKELTNSSGNSESLTFPWGDATGGLLTSKNGIPSTRCKVTFSQPSIDNNGKTFFGSWSRRSTGLFPVRYDFTIVEEAEGSDVTHTFSLNDALGYFNDTISSASWPGQANSFNLRNDHVVQGSDVTGGAKNTLASLQSTVRAGSYDTPGNYSGWDVLFIPEFRATATRSWEANLYIIDGLNNDSLDFTTVTSTMSATGSVKLAVPSNLSSTTTINEDSVNVKFGASNLVSTTTFNVTPAFKLGGVGELDVTTNTLMTTANLALASASLQGTTAMTIVPLFKPGVDDTLVATTSTSISAGLKYDITGDYTWDVFNLNTYFEAGFSVDDFVTIEGEYTWNFLASSSWDDWPVDTWLGNEQSWDNWPNDVWEKDFVLESASSMLLTPLFKLGDTVSYTGTFTLAELSAFEQAAELDVVSTFTISPTASGVIDVSITITSAMSPSLTANITYSLDDSPIAITGAFNTVLTASAITDTFADIDVTSSISITPTFKPSGLLTITAATEFDLSPTFKPAGLAALTAFASTLQVGRLFFQADPFNTIKVDAETRTIVLPVENRQILVMAENRVNIVSAETRAHLVPQETRSLKLKVPPMTNRFSTPRVRSNH
jgi:hypothetical protein